jgi:hypothetical protein
MLAAMKTLLAALLLLPCWLGAAVAHRVAVQAGPEPTPEQRQQMLKSTVADLQDLQSQLAAAIELHADARQLDALRKMVATYDSMVLEMRHRDMFDTLLQATLAKDLPKFQALCADQMKAAITAEALATASANLHAALGASPYTVLTAGTMRRAGQAVLLYVLRPDDGADDVLVMMSIDHDRCSGFALR